MIEIAIGAIVLMFPILLWLTLTLSVQAVSLILKLMLKGR